MQKKQITFWAAIATVLIAFSLYSQDRNISTKANTVSVETQPGLSPYERYENVVTRCIATLDGIGEGQKYFTSEQMEALCILREYRPSDSKSINSLMRVIALEIYSGPEAATLNPMGVYTPDQLNRNPAAEVLVESGQYALSAIVFAIDNYPVKPVSDDTLRLYAIVARRILDFQIGISREYFVAAAKNAPVESSKAYEKFLALPEMNRPALSSGRRSISSAISNTATTVPAMTRPTSQPAK